MTTTSDLIEYLKKFPSNTVVFTNRHDDEFNTERPIDFDSCVFFPEACIFEKDGEVQYLEFDDDDDDHFSETLYRPVLKLCSK